MLIWLDSFSGKATKIMWWFQGRTENIWQIKAFSFLYNGRLQEVRINVELLRGNEVDERQ